ncbi:MAG: sodium/proline symporter [Xanthomonadales bacterium]|nr:sodium/proline symporter [Xanthomonadales bacterium]
MSRETIILTTLVGYKLLLIGIGLWAQRRTHDNSDYFLAGRRLGPVVAAISYAASSSSAWTLLGVSGAAYSLGLGALWLLPGIVTCHIVAWFWLAPRMRISSAEHDQITLTDVLAQGTQGTSRAAIVAIASAIVLFCFLFYVAAQFQGAGNTFIANFDISRNEAIVVGGIVVLVYTLLGGFWAVSVTDALQGLLMAGAAVVLPVAALAAVGGPGQLLEGLRSVSSADQLSWTAGNAGLLAIGFAVGLMLVGLGTFGQPQLLNRFMALRDETALRQARMMAISWFVVVLAGMLLLGLCGHVLMPDAGNGETVFFGLTNQLFPVVIGGIITAAVLSAIMSTADSQLLVAASCIAHDLGLARRFPAHALTISRITMSLVCVAAVLIAILLPATIFARVLFAWNGLGSALGPVVMARVLDRHVVPGAVMAAMIVGFGLTAVLYSLPNTPGDIAERAVPFLLSGLIVFLGSRPAADADLER